MVRRAFPAEVTNGQLRFQESLVDLEGRRVMVVLDDLPTKVEDLPRLPPDPVQFDDRDIEQDVSFRMPFRWEKVTATNEFERNPATVVILSQSCDLANDKLEIIQVCPVFPLEQLATDMEFFRSQRGREELRRGSLSGYHLLNRCEIPGHESDLLVCDFRSLFGVHIEVAKSLATEQSPRHRMLPPYREHLAQSFARFFMRVGLPVDVPPFV